MKKLLWLVLYPAFAFSCSSDGEERKDINGTWVLTAVIRSQCRDSNEVGFAYEDHDLCSDDECLLYEFNQGEYTSTMHSNNEASTRTGTYKIFGSILFLDGRKIVFTRSNNSMSLSYRWQGCKVTEGYALLR